MVIKFMTNQSWTRYLTSTQVSYYNHIMRGSKIATATTFTGSDQYLQLSFRQQSFSRLTFLLSWVSTCIFIPVKIYHPQLPGRQTLVTRQGDVKLWLVFVSNSNEFKDRLIYFAPSQKLVKYFNESENPNGGSKFVTTQHWAESKLHELYYGLHPIRKP